MPVHHTVLLKLIPGLTEAMKENAIKVCREGLAKCPQGKNGSVSAPIFTERAGGYEIGIYREFKDADEFQAYRADPAHLAVLGGILKETVESMVSFQIQG